MISAATLARALYLAEAAGLDATGFTADLHPYGTQGTKSDVREVLSRVKAVVDTTLDTDAVGGPPIPITGDGRASWGPLHRQEPRQLVRLRAIPVGGGASCTFSAKTFADSR